METLIETKEDFENYLISVIEKSEGINIATLLNPSNPAGLKMTVKDKEFIRKLYLKKKDYGLSHLLMEIIPKYPEIICIDDTKQNKDAWVYKIDRNIDTHNIQNSNVRLSEKEKTSSLGEESVHEQTVESDTKLLSTTKVIEIQEEAEELPIDFNTAESDKKQKDNELAKLIRTNMVKINKDLCISKYVVTQNLYEKVMGNNPSHFKEESSILSEWSGLPVDSVNFYEAVDFCNRLSILCGKSCCYGEDGSLDVSKNGFRLPYEDEWKYVANGGANIPSFKYAGSDNQNAVAWYKTNSKAKTHDVTEPKIGVKIKTKEVFGMCGNVWEWCWTLSENDSKTAVCYGGSFEDSEAFLELGKKQNKIILDKNEKKSNVGFRIVVNHRF